MSRRPGTAAEFDPTSPHLEPWTREPIVPLEVFYYYDCPMLFSAAVGPFVMLFSKYDELEDTDLYTVSLVDDTMLSALGNAELSVFGAVACDMRFMIEMDGMSVLRAWKCGVENLPARRLATRGVACMPGKPSVPDVLPGYRKPEWALRRMRHLTRGSSYDVISEAANVQASRPIVEGDLVAVYVADDETTWVRLVSEFNDGRFEETK
ncbi:hypothetical protein G6L37_01035 [Agrobacterium rubi]|nr:hypothetical protein [Agrobacterium rubi]NTF23976.1 hypothetical protein [Agrobacterium rubi]